MPSAPLNFFSLPEPCAEGSAELGRRPGGVTQGTPMGPRNAPRAGSECWGLGAWRSWHVDAGAEFVLIVSLCFSETPPRRRRGAAEARGPRGAALAVRHRRAAVQLGPFRRRERRGRPRGVRVIVFLFPAANARITQRAFAALASVVGDLLSHPRRLRLGWTKHQKPRGLLQPLTERSNKDTGLAFPSRTRTSRPSSISF